MIKRFFCFLFGHNFIVSIYENDNFHINCTKCNLNKDKVTIFYK